MFVFGDTPAEPNPSRQLACLLSDSVAPPNRVRSRARELQRKYSTGHLNGYELAQRC
jgi:hypothetical protein